MFYKEHAGVCVCVCVCVLPVQPGLQGCWVWLLWSLPAADSDLCDSEHKRPSRRLWMEPQEAEQRHHDCDKLKDEGKSDKHMTRRCRSNCPTQHKGAEMSSTLKEQSVVLVQYVNEKRKILLMTEQTVLGSDSPLSAAPVCFFKLLIL